MKHREINAPNHTPAVTEVQTQAWQMPKVSPPLLDVILISIFPAIKIKDMIIIGTLKNIKKSGQIIFLNMYLFFT